MLTEILNGAHLCFIWTSNLVIMDNKLFGQQKLLMVVWQNIMLRNCNLSCEHTLWLSSARWMYISWAWTRLLIVFVCVILESQAWQYYTQTVETSCSYEASRGTGCGPEKFLCNRCRDLTHCSNSVNAFVSLCVLLLAAENANCSQMEAETRVYNLKYQP